MLWWQGADPAAAALRQRHQGPGGLARLLRAARDLGQRRQPGADPRRRHPERRQRRRARRRQGRALAPEEGRDLARRQALHRRRRRLHLGVRARSGDGRGHDRASTRTSPSPRSTTTPSSSRSRTPTPFWATAFVAAEGMIIPKHLFGPYAGAKSREAPTNLKPVGTGPYTFVDFKPGDLVTGALNKNYHMPNRPHFDTIEMKGGGDATSAARAVLQTGEYDYAWNLQVEDEVLKRMEAGGKGKAHIVPSGDIEFIQVNITDPWNEVEGERGSIKSKHFAFSDKQVREAMSLLCDKKSMQEFIYGRTGVATANFMNAPVALPLAEHEVGVQRRQGQRPARRRRLEAGCRRHPRKGRQEDEVRLPDVDQPDPPEGAGDRQAGGAEGRHRPRAEVGDGLGVLLVRLRQPRHLPEVLGRPADVHHDHDRARRRALHGPVHRRRGLAEGEQVGRPEHLPLRQPGVRQAGRSRPSRSSIRSSGPRPTSR